MKKLYLILWIIFSLLTIAGAVYILINKGQASPGYACVPMLFALVSSSLYRLSLAKENSDKDK